ncbi:hypothetical protein DP939_19420 [Spongiactinospora rosea]|uniref:Uncharacterized protein n=1 Tax=Spongiactinospora rosea TaxID=2248750 RepID=A0A366LXI0_9ACTN|nr:DUF6461 domain-containing protein [Spongiactinospora rosea]RBQ18655.1 hypothetical protein DP939_19420 [Spongiactinospora rosea]
MRSRTHLHDLLVSTIFTEGLDAEPDLWALGFSAIWIKGADLDTLATEWHMDPTTRTPCHLSEILDRNIDDGSNWVAEVNGWIAIVPGHADGERLRAASEGGREVLGIRMDITGHEHFEYARDGRMVASFEPTFPDQRYGEDPHALDHLMAGLRFQLSEEGGPDDRVEQDESVSSALALIGRHTGTDIATDWIQARHSAFRPAAQ